MRTSVLPASLHTALGRGALFYLSWIAMAGTGALDLVVGLVAAALAAWTSLLLLPPGLVSISPAGLARLALRFPRQSLIAGIDVARRAFDPGLPLRPGLVSCPATLGPGLARDTFLALASLQPGSLPIAEGADGTVLLHVLDTRQPNAERFAAEEVVFNAALASPAATEGVPHRG